MSDEANPDLDDVFVRFAQSLAHQNKRRRTASVKALRSWLSGKNATQLTFSACLKLHKALYYCMWLCDTMLAQQELAAKLARLLNAISDRHCVINYLTAFYCTMIREWPLLDKHRLDKYYFLLRCVARESFSWLIRQEWAPKVVVDYTQMLATTLLAPSVLPDTEQVFPNNHTVSAALQIHFAESLLDELRVAITNSATTPDSCRVAALLMPLVDLMAQTPHRAVRKAALKAMLPLSSDAAADLLVPAERAALAALFAEAAKSAETHEPNRPLMYRMAALFEEEETTVEKEDVLAAAGTRTPGEVALRRKMSKKHRRRRKKKAAAVAAAGKKPPGGGAPLSEKALVAELVGGDKKPGGNEAKKRPAAASELVGGETKKRPAASSPLLAETPPAKKAKRARAASAGSAAQATTTTTSKPQKLGTKSVSWGHLLRQTFHKNDPPITVKRSKGVDYWKKKKEGASE